MARYMGDDDSGEESRDGINKMDTEPSAQEALEVINNALLAIDNFKKKRAELEKMIRETDDGLALHREQLDRGTRLLCKVSGEVAESMERSVDSKPDLDHMRPHISPTSGLWKTDGRA